MSAHSTIFFNSYKLKSKQRDMETETKEARNTEVGRQRQLKKDWKEKKYTQRRHGEIDQIEKQRLIK